MHQDMDTPIFIHLLALLPLAAFAYVTWRLVRHREKVAAALTAAVTLGLLLLQPLSQMAADSLLARPYAERQKAAADAAALLGKDFPAVVRQLGEPARIRVESGTIVTTATRAITRRLEPYTALEYFPASALYMGTRFIVFLDASGVVTSYRIKWEKSPNDRCPPACGTTSQLATRG
jgi:hypothetical protein